VFVKLLTVIDSCAWAVSVEWVGLTVLTWRWTSDTIHLQLCRGHRSFDWVMWVWVYWCWMQVTADIHCWMLWDTTGWHTWRVLSSPSSSSCHVT